MSATPSNLRHRVTFAQQQQQEPATSSVAVSSPAEAQAAYEKLLEDIQHATQEAHPSLSFLGVETSTTRTKLKFESQLTEVNVSQLCATLSSAFAIPVSCHVRHIRGAQEIILVVPLPQNIKWRCFERLSPLQIAFIAQSVLLALVVMAAGVHIVRWLWHI